MGCWFHTMYTGGTGRSQVSLDVVQEFLGLVDLGGQVRRAAAVRVVQQHHLVFVSFHLVSHQHHVRGRVGGGGLCSNWLRLRQSLGTNKEDILKSVPFEIFVCLLELPCFLPFHVIQVSLFYPNG